MVLAGYSQEFKSDVPHVNFTHKCTLRFLDLDYYYISAFCGQPPVRLQPELVTAKLINFSPIMYFVKSCEDQVGHYCSIFSKENILDKNLLLADWLARTSAVCRAASPGPSLWSTFRLGSPS